jgi:cytochrome b
MALSSPVRVWDLPTRLFHWLLVALFAFSWWSAENHAMDWHRLSGIVLLGLLLFRLIWGFIGGSTARFAAFVRSPRHVLGYLRREPIGATPAGHNPLGGYSVVAMLALLAVQVGTGLFAVDVDGLESGHLSHLVSFEQGRAAAEIHELSFNLLLVVIGLHILAVLFYLAVRRRNLISPMVTGRDGQLEAIDGALVGAGWVRFAIAVVLAGLAAWWTSQGLGL